MAARLVQIKSSLLLPRHEEAERLRQGVDRGIDRISALPEAARRLAKRHIGGDLFVRVPEEREPDTTYRRRHAPAELLDAFLAAAYREGESCRLPPRRSAESYPVPLYRFLPGSPMYWENCTKGTK